MKANLITALCNQKSLQVYNVVCLQTLRENTVFKFKTKSNSMMADAGHF